MKMKKRNTRQRNREIKVLQTPAVQLSSSVLSSLSFCYSLLTGPAEIKIKISQHTKIQWTTVLG